MDPREAELILDRLPLTLRRTGDELMVGLRAGRSQEGLTKDADEGIPPLLSSAPMEEKEFGAQ